MNFTEWPLAVFTLMLQMLAGLTLIAETARWRNPAGADRSFAGSETMAFGLGAAAMLVSLGHLGNPLHSPFAIFHVASSWLSREILTSSLFVAALGGLALARRRQQFARLAPPLAALAGLAGLLAVWSMSRVYMLPTVPAWNTPATPLNFFGSTFLLGGLAAGGLAGWRADHPAGREQPAAGGWGLIALFVALGLAMKAVEIPFDLIAGATANARGESVLSLLAVLGWPLYAIRVVLPLAGAAIFIGGLLRRTAGQRISGGAVTGLAVALAGEMLGRLIFYSSHLLNGL